MFYLSPPTGLDSGDKRAGKVKTVSPSSAEGQNEVKAPDPISLPPPRLGLCFRGHQGEQNAQGYRGHRGCVGVAWNSAHV